ncbi:glutathione peroxidase [Cohnella kolymensis]|uniref:Glutathione peroxidase n=1 Tax=Cohnella kolymensis TaxID=1590652 RepID=A0ABR4ZZR0_9BACL|nr:glutathione peroxidase [Cohnella kolymensis]KIL34290.1 glutathione peroxidase [Cohnella kolymensis]
MSIYDYSVRQLNGVETGMSSYRDKVLLIVNTASQCGFTPQYAELQKLYETYRERGLFVLGFPCNQFGAQEPGSAEEVAEFCSINYGVTFPMFEKTLVQGPDAHPLFQYLTGETDGEIKWNFTKFLVDRNGRVVQQYDSSVKPLEIAPDLEKLL